MWDHNFAAQDSLHGRFSIKTYPMLGMRTVVLFCMDWLSWQLSETPWRVCLAMLGCLVLRVSFSGHQYDEEP